MIFDVITILPDMFEAPLSAGVLGRAVQNGLLNVRLHDLREYADDAHRSTDDYPYGGGGGMVMKPEPLGRAIEAVRDDGSPAPVIFLTPQGVPFTQRRARSFAQEERLVMLCGRYEGVDERVRELYVDEEISIGDYVLTGGELPAMVMIDAVARMIPGVLGCSDSAEEDSFSSGLLDFPQYTRPDTFKGCRIPSVLLSGDHREIRRWRERQALYRTYLRRPDLIQEESLDEEKKNWLSEWRRESPDVEFGGDSLPERVARHERD